MKNKNEKDNKYEIVINEICGFPLYSLINGYMNSEYVFGNFFELEYVDDIIRDKIKKEKTIKITVSYEQFCELNPPNTIDSMDLETKFKICEETHINNGTRELTEEDEQFFNDLEERSKTYSKLIEKFLLNNKI